MNQDAWNRDNGDLAQGVRMIAVAVVSALATATFVIAIGQSVIDRQTPAQSTSDAVLIRTSG